MNDPLSFSILNFIWLFFFKIRKNFSQLLEEDAINNPNTPKSKALLSSFDEFFFCKLRNRKSIYTPEVYFLVVYSSNHILQFIFFRFRKNFSQLLEEDAINNPDAPNYLSAQAPVSTKPKRHLCSVCGYISNSYCPSCGIRYRSLKCYDTHVETRCMKYTA